MFNNHTIDSLVNYHYFSGIYQILIAFFGIICNLAVIIQYTKSSHVKKSSSYYFINLATSDLLLLVTTIPLSATSSFHEKWIFGSLGCNLYGLFGGLFGFTSIGTIVLISIERYIAVTRPIGSLENKTNVSLFAILLTWIYAFIWISLPLFSQNQFVLEGLLTSCTFDYVSRDWINRLIMISMTIGGFLMPLAIIIIAYVMIMKKLSERRTKFDKIRTPNSSFTSRSSVHKLNKTIEEVHFTRIQYKALKNILLLIILFLVSWLPYTLLTFSYQFFPNFNQLIDIRFTYFAHIFAKTSATFNPLIYAYRKTK
jgi:r-opsin